MDEQFAIEVEALSAALDDLDYFGILKLPQTATPAEIKLAYYHESRAFHPDRFAAYPDAEFREQVGRIYKRVNEAYTVLRDDKKRLRYVADMNGPDRAQKLRFTEADEVAVKEEQKRKLEEQLGQTPNGRKFYAAALADLQAGRFDAALRAIRSALMYEPTNPKFKEQLAALESRLDQGRAKGDSFKIK